MFVYYCYCSAGLTNPISFNVFHYYISERALHSHTFCFFSTQWTKTKVWRFLFSCGSTCGLVSLPMRRSSTASQRETSVYMLKWCSSFLEYIFIFSYGFCNIYVNSSLAFSMQYENQAQVFGKWGTTGLVGRHKFSDVTGKVKLKQERFLPPRGWEWEEDWFVDPERW